MLLASRQRSGHGQDQQTDATHSTAGSTGQSGSYKSVSPTDLMLSTWTFMVLLSKEHHTMHIAQRHGDIAASRCRPGNMAQEPI